MYDRTPTVPDRAILRPTVTAGVIQDPDDYRPGPSANYGVSLLPGAPTLFRFRLLSDAEECARVLDEEVGGLECPLGGDVGSVEIVGDGLVDEYRDQFGPESVDDLPPMTPRASREGIVIVGREGEVDSLSDDEARALASRLLSILDGGDRG